MSLEVRQATADDEDAVLDLLEELFVAPGWRPEGYDRARAAKAFQWAVENPRADVLVARDDGVPVGIASVYVEFPSMRFGRKCWLEDLVVTAARRRGGVGRVLLDAATEWARMQHCPELALSSAAARKDAHRFYLANGMSESMRFGRAVPRR